MSNEKLLKELRERTVQQFLDIVILEALNDFSNPRSGPDIVNYIHKNFGLAKDIAMTLEENQVNLKIFDSIYKNLYSAENNLKSISLLGCPIASAVACVLAKVSGKAVAIQKHKVSPDGLTIEVWYRIGQG